MFKKKMWKYNYTNELYHYGVKGMKWGVRRTKEQLEHDRYSIEARLNKKLPNIQTPNGVKVQHISEHALNRTEDLTRRVTVNETINALTKPLYIRNTVIDNKGRPSQRYIGYYATVNVNPDTGCVTTVWKTGDRVRRKLMKKGK